MFKKKADGLLATGLFIYMDYRRPISPTEILFWEASRRWGSMCSWLGIQYASIKVQPPSQVPVPWDGTVTNTKGGVHGLVSQERCDKTQRLIA